VQPQQQPIPSSPHATKEELAGGSGSSIRALRQPVRPQRITALPPTDTGRHASRPPTQSHGHAAHTHAQSPMQPAADPSEPRPFLDALRDCNSWQAISQLWGARQQRLQQRRRDQQQEEASSSVNALAGTTSPATTSSTSPSSGSSSEEQLAPEALAAAVEKLARLVAPRTLGARAQSHLRTLLTQLTASAQPQLAEMPHALVPRVLGGLSALHYVAEPRWVRTAMQHAATSLASYGPGELALLISYAARATLLARAMAAPTSMFGASRAAVPMPAAGGNPWRRAAPRQPQPTAAPSSSTTAEQPKPVVVVTNAWLDHFMSAFERFLSAPPPPKAATAAAAQRAAAAHASPAASFDAADRGSASEALQQQQHARAQQQQQPDAKQPLRAQHMDAVLSALVTLKATPDPSWLYVFCRQLGSQLAAQSVPPQTLVSIAASLAALGYRLPDHLAGQFERQVGAALPTLAPRELESALRALSAFRHRPSDAWVGQLFRRLILASSHFNSSAVVALVAGASALGYSLEPHWIDALLLQARHALGALAPHEHVGLIDALSAQHYRPGSGFMEEYMEALSAHLPRLTFAQLAALLAGLAAVSYKPPPQWMRTCMLTVVAAAPGPGDVPDLMRLLAALKRMQYTPTGDILSGIEAHVDRIAINVEFRTTQQLRAALAALEYSPYARAEEGEGAAGEGDEEGGGELEGMVEALLGEGGTEAGAAMLEEVVEAAASEAAHAAAAAAGGRVGLDGGAVERDEEGGYEVGLMADAAAGLPAAA